MDIEASTLSDNVTALAGGGVRNEENATATVKNTIIAGNEDAGGNPDCSGELTSQGYNLIEQIAGCTLAGDETGNITSTESGLGPLADNGGPTHTHALLPGSPAIDAGSPNCPPPTGDQRGVERPVDGNGDGTAACDIGAFEAPQGTTTPSPTPSPTASPTPTPTATAGTPTPTPTPTPTSTPTPTPTSTAPASLVGDTDCNEKVDAVDALWVLRDVAGMDTTAACLEAANVKCDDGLTSVDALFILRFVAALPNNLPAGCTPVGE